MIALSRRSYIALAILAAILVAGWIVGYYVFLSPTGIVAREQADLARIQSEGNTFVSLDGTPVDIDTYRKGVVVVNMWASWSPYTGKDHEVLSEVASNFDNEVSVLAVNRMETKETAEAYLQTIGKHAGIEYVIDGGDRFFGSFEGYAMPETIVFDRVGNIAFHKRGPLEREELVAVLETLVSE